MAGARNASTASAHGRLCSLNIRERLPRHKLEREAPSSEECGMRSTKINAGLLCLATATSIMSAVSGHAQAASFTVSWDFSASGAAGFALYCGTSSGSYATRYNVGNTTTFTVTGATAGTGYFCVVTAYDAAGVESPHSNEISVPIPTAAPVPPPKPPVPPPVAR